MNEFCSSFLPTDIPVGLVNNGKRVFPGVGTPHGYKNMWKINFCVLATDNSLPDVTFLKCGNEKDDFLARTVAVEEVSPTGALTITQFSSLETIVLNQLGKLLVILCASTKLQLNILLAKSGISCQIWKWDLELVARYGMKSENVWISVSPDDSDQDNGTKLLYYFIAIGPGRNSKTSN
ncbi:hypothetical protein TNCV_1031021 [Trichonephila clavipes]|nr:hypothetical protein TNCV_1031021 [Trichonephila clavipes]